MRKVCSETQTSLVVQYLRLPFHEPASLDFQENLILGSNVMVLTKLTLRPLSTGQVEKNLDISLANLSERTSTGSDSSQ